MKRLIYICISILCTANLFAFETDIQDSTTVSDTISQSMLLPESLEMDVDSLLNTWHARYFTAKYADCMDSDDIILLPDSTYRERLDRLPRIINLPYNEQVREGIELYVVKKRKLLRYILGMADFYFPVIEQILDEYGLPIELKYLAVVESALNPVAVSRMGATGMWQFMLATGKIYGLEINSLVDERRDPVKATHAACCYFKDMYQIYGDWNLVMASYNCGPGNVNKAIRRAGGKTDFWQIYPYLPTETRNYVPLFIAANYAMNYYCEHNICPAQTNLPAHTDTIMVDEMLHLAQLSETLNLPMDQLRALNPQFKRDIVPGNQRPFAVNLPLQTACQFVALEDTIFKHRAAELFPGRGDNTFVSSVAGGSSSSRDVFTHTVRRGETLSKIANKYRVEVKDIKKWNGLKSNTLAIGKRLRIYTGNAPVPKTTAAATVKKEERTPASVGKSASSAFTYKVKSGDSLYSIAKNYPGVSVESLRSHNNLSSNNLKVGQVLKIPKV
ncbi:MAG: LysM peptidoglycan-binding domain-containing protein [Bacteroidales bacterium]|nr:LysM peptidoglycan-binding domain-containing protein [Bacteroidales bacterium]